WFAGARFKREMWRAEERDSRNPREVGANERKEHVERRRKRLSRERHGIEHLTRDVGGSKDFSREIDVRQRLVHHQRNSIENGRFNRSAALPPPPREGCHLFFTIARDMYRDVARRHDKDGLRRRHPLFEARFFDSGKPLMDSLVKTARE